VTPSPKKAPNKAPNKATNKVTNKATNFRRAPKPSPVTQAEVTDEPARADDSPNGEQGAASA
jgi:hypothetical protein